MNRYVVPLSMALGGVVLMLVFGTHFGAPPSLAPLGAIHGTPRGQPLVEVIVPELEGEAAMGEEVYAMNCMACHGLNAAGQAGIAPPLVHKLYEPGAHGDSLFYEAVAHGVAAHHWSFGNMPPIEGLSEIAVACIVAYIRALQVANGIL